MSEAVARHAAKVPAVTLGFWIITIVATTLGETGGDTLSMTLDWGYLAATTLFVAILAALVLALLYFRTAADRVALFWAAFILTRPLGATLGDFFDKPNDKGGLDVSRPLASAVLAAAMVLLILVVPRRPASG